MACPWCHTSLYGSNPLVEALLIIFQVRKEMLLDSEALRQFQNHSSQMAALDFIVSTASDVFLPTYDGNMAKLVEGHRRYVQQDFIFNQIAFHVLCTHSHSCATRLGVHALKSTIWL
jgi:hypothetical protein